MPRQAMRTRPGATGKVNFKVAEVAFDDEAEAFENIIADPEGDEADGLAHASTGPDRNTLQVYTRSGWA